MVKVVIDSVRAVVDSG